MYVSATRNRRFILRRIEEDTLKTKGSGYDDLGGLRKRDLKKFASRSPNPPLCFWWWTPGAKQENRVLISQKNGQHHREEIHKLVFGVSLNSLLLYLNLNETSFFLSHPKIKSINPNSYILSTTLLNLNGQRFPDIWENPATQRKEVKWKGKKGEERKDARERRWGKGERRGEGHQKKTVKNLFFRRNRDYRGRS